LYFSGVRVPVAQWTKARLTFFVQGSSALQIVTGAAAYGNKESDFDSPTVADFPSGAAQNITGDGAVYGTSFGTLDVQKQLVDFGVKCINSAPNSTHLEHATVTLVVDLME
jgi:hypothetical protein